MSRRKWPEFTEEWAEKIVDKYVGLLCSNWMLPSGCIKYYEINNRRMPVIFINYDLHNREYHCETFTHELIHIFDDICQKQNNESRVVRTSVQFYHDHKCFMEKLFSRLEESNKYIVLKKHCGDGTTWTNLERILLCKLHELYGQN
jgi:hypothetical protein